MSEKPVIYEIVPPKLGSSESEIERRIELLERVLRDSRINAINIPELKEKRETNGQASYVPTTIPPEEYAELIGGSKEKIVNIVSPHLTQEEFTQRVCNLKNYGIKNLVVVGKARKSDLLHGPSVLEALDLVSAMNQGHAGEKTDILLGGICIFHRNRKTDHEYEAGSIELNEHERTAIKARHGCRFVTSQIIFDAKVPLEFLAKYAAHCEQGREKPVTIFISLSTVKSLGILSLLTDVLEVQMPDQIKKKLQREPDKMGKLSVEISTEIFARIIEWIKSNRIDIPIGLHIEQVGTNSDDVSLELLDRTYAILKTV